MNDILERARQTQRDVAMSTHVTIRLTLLQDLITEIERLRSLPPVAAMRAIGSIKDVNARHQLKEDPS